MVLLTLMTIIAIGIVRMRNLFAVVVLGSIYSFLMATVFLVLDAVDVAMTEAAVGAGVATVLMLAVLSMTKTEETVPVHSPALPLFVSAVTAVALIYGTLDLPPFGAADAPPHVHVAPKYLADSIKDTTVPNVVASVLADYRSFDTLGEVIVVFTAAIGVLVLFRSRPRRRRPERAAAAGPDAGSGPPAQSEPPAKGEPA